MTGITLEDLDKVIRKLKVACFVMAGVSLIAIGGFIYNALGIGDISQRVTNVESSPCTAHPQGVDCQDIKYASESAQSLSTACIQFRIVVPVRILREFTKCPETAPINPDPYTPPESVATVPES